MGSLLQIIANMKEMLSVKN